MAWSGDSMRSVTMLAVFAACTALNLPAAAVQARSPAHVSDRPFNPSDPAYAALKLLEGKADAMDESPDIATEIQLGAWRALYDAAIKVHVPPAGVPHPLAGYALAQIAVFTHEDGDDKLALEQAERSLELTRPFREFYPDSYIQSVSVTGYLKSALGKPSEAAVALAEGADWYQAYFDRLPAAQRTEGVYMAKSNIDYAYSQNLSTLGQFDKAVDWQWRSLEARRKAVGPTSPTAISSVWNYAFALSKAGRADEAEDYARQAVQLAIDHVDPRQPAYVRTFDALGLLLARRGKRAEAVDYVRRSIAIRRENQGSDNSNFFSSLMNLGDVLLQLERYDEARPLLIEASQGWLREKSLNRISAAQALAKAGLADLGLGNAAEAAAKLRSSLEMVRRDDSREQFISRLLIPALIVADLELGNRVEARRAADAFLMESRALSSAPAAELAHAELLAAQASDDAAAAIAKARAAMEVVRRDHILAASGELPQVERLLLETVLQVAAQASDAQLALDAMVVLAGSKIAQANRLVADRLVGADPALAMRIREQQDMAKTLAAADGDWLKAAATGDRASSARARRDIAAANLAVVRARLQRDFPRWTEASGVVDPDLMRLQRDLSAKEAIVAIVPAFDGVYTLTITHRTARVRRTPLSRAAIVDRIARLRASLPAGAFDAASAFTLHEQFFPKADADLLKGVSSLRIVPAGPIAALPFATLLERPVKTAGRGAPWLLRRYAIEVAPGFTATSGSAQARAEQGRRLLAIGAPTPFGVGGKQGKVLGALTYFRGGAADASALAELPPLPGSAKEVAAVGQAFGAARATLLTGDGASEARVKAMDLKPFSTILFATHGLVSGEMEGVAEPALVLARPITGEHDDGVLTASEIATLRLDADWIILSACNTAAGERIEASAYSGLAQAFRYAGARTLLVSHWPVRDDAASFITVATIANARHGQPRDVALQRAMLDLMDSRSIPDAADPYIWAPYILLGATGG